MDTPGNDAPYAIGEISAPGESGDGGDNPLFTPTVALDDGSFLLAYRVTAPGYFSFSSGIGGNGSQAYFAPGGQIETIQFGSVVPVSPGSDHYFVSGLDAAGQLTSIEVTPANGLIVVTETMRANFAQDSRLSVIVTGLAPGNLTAFITTDDVRDYDPAGTTDVIDGSAVVAGGFAALGTAIGLTTGFELVNAASWTNAATTFRIYVSSNVPLDLTGVSGVLQANGTTGADNFVSVIDVAPINGVVAVPETLLEQLQSHEVQVLLLANGATNGATAQVHISIEHPVTIIEEGLFVQHFDSTGEALAAAVRIDDAGSTLLSNVLLDDDTPQFSIQHGTGGSLFVSWIGDGDNDGGADTIYVRPIGADGVPTGDAIALTGLFEDAISAETGLPAITQLADGSYVIGYGVEVQTSSLQFNGTSTPGGQAPLFIPPFGQLTHFQFAQFSPGANVVVSLRGDDANGLAKSVNVSLVDGGFTVTEALLAQFAPDSHLLVAVTGLAPSTPFVVIMETRDIFDFDASSTTISLTRISNAANNPVVLSDVFFGVSIGQPVGFHVNALTINPAEAQNYYLTLTADHPLDLTGLTLYTGPTVSGLGLFTTPNTQSNGAFSSTIIVTPIAGQIDVPPSILAQIDGDGLRASLGISGLVAGTPVNVSITVRHASAILEPGLFVQHFDVDGAATGDGHRIDGGVLGDAADLPGLTLIPTAGGGYRASWYGDSDGDGEADQIVSQEYDVAGSPIGPGITLDGSDLPQLAAAGDALHLPSEAQFVPFGNGGYAMLYQIDTPTLTQNIFANVNNGRVVIPVALGRATGLQNFSPTGAEHYFLDGKGVNGQPISVEITADGTGRVEVSAAQQALFAPDHPTALRVEGLTNGTFFNGAYFWDDVWDFGSGGTATQITTVTAANGFGVSVPSYGEATSFKILNMVPIGDPPTFTVIVAYLFPVGPNASFDQGTGLWNTTFAAALVGDTVTVPPEALAQVEQYGARIVLFVAGLQNGTPLIVEATVREPTISADDEGLFILTFDQNGVVIGDPIRADSAVAGVLEGQDNVPASLQSDGNGGLIVGWRSDTDGDGDSDGLFYQHFDASGNRVGETVAITEVPDRVFGDEVPVKIYTAGIFADPDAGDTLTFAASGLPAGVSINAATGVISGLPQAGGLFHVIVTATDQGGLSANSAFTVLILGDGSDNSPPLAAAAPETFVGSEDTAASGTLLAGSDPNGDALTFALVGSSALHGSVTIDAETGAFNFTPDADYSGAASFQYFVSDGSLSSDPKTVTIQLAAVNDGPTAVSLANAATSTSENGGLIKVADIVVSDDGLGGNQLTLVGSDAARFSIVGGALYFIGADYEALPTKHSFDVTVVASDPAVPGYAPVSADFTLALTDVAEAKSFNGGNKTDNLAVDPASIDNYTVDGGVGADNLATGAGNDNITGGVGSDVINAGAGNDTIRGGNNDDVLTGGLGLDTFVYGTPGESGVGNSDHITDFNALFDLIDLSLIDANSRAGGNQSFDFIGGDAFSRQAGELRFTTSGGNGFLQGDINGDGKADFQIVLDGVTDLPANPLEFLIA